MKNKTWLILLLSFAGVIIALAVALGFLAIKGMGISYGIYLEARNNTPMMIVDNSPMKMSRRSDREIFDGLESLLLGLETRDFDDMGKPRKGKGPKALDHHCDAFEYAVWHIIHTITGYDRLLDKIAAVHHNRYTYGGWDD